MPELPEVETIKLGLEKLVPGKQIVGVTFDWPKSFPNAKADVNKFLVSAKIVSVARRGKVLIFELNTQHSLVVHLKMTGQLVYRSEDFAFGAGHPNASLVGNLPDKSTRVQIQFTDKSILFFNDQRKFGWVRLLPTLEIESIDLLKKMGPEPLNAEFTANQFCERLKRRANSPIKAVLLDQSIIAGVGNIYADESLWGAKIHSLTKVKDVSDKSLSNLFGSLREVLDVSIKSGGSTDKNYVDALGKKGSYLTFAKVFRRNGQPCPRCGSIIVKIRAVGRGTHLCPKCQRQT